MCNMWHELMVETVSLECFIWNWLMTGSNRQAYAPYKAINVMRPEVSHIWTFGCKVLVYKAKSREERKCDLYAANKIPGGWWKDNEFRIQMIGGKKVLETKNVNFGKVNETKMTEGNKTEIEIDISNSNILVGGIQTSTISNDDKTENEETENKRKIPKEERDLNSMEEGERVGRARVGN